MPSFEKMFIESRGDPVSYKGNTLVCVDKFPVRNGDVLLASIEKTSGNSRQGFSIDITGYCEMEGHIFRKGKGIKLVFWEDTITKPIKLKVFTKQGFVWIQNIWEKTSRYLISNSNGEPQERESKTTDFGHNGAAMIIEEIEKGKRYKCNDNIPDEDFDDIIFTVQNLGQG
jgi:hypothetical protein